MSIKGAVVACAAGVGLAAAIALPSVIDHSETGCPPASELVASQTAAAGQGGGHGDEHGHGHGHGGRRLLVGPSCNLVETAAPPDSKYRPDVAGASRADRQRARALLRGANEFCRSHSAAELTAAWLPGQGAETPTHYFNPDRRGSLGPEPSNPRAALVYRGEIAGVMLTGTPLPHLGSIPRAHTHDESRPREMVHVYCTANLADAFTPSRQLGVLADSIALRHKIRPRITHLVDPRLAAIHRQVRAYLGSDLPRVEPSTVETPAADPARRAQRQEIRQSLLLLTEPELRAVLSMVKAVSSRDSHPSRG